MEGNEKIQTSDGDDLRARALELIGKRGRKKQDWPHDEYWGIYRNAFKSDQPLDHLKVLLMLCFKKYPDSTMREIMEIVLEGAYKESTLTARRRELELMGLIECSGQRKCIVSGKIAKTWKVKETL